MHNNIIKFTNSSKKVIYKNTLILNMPFIGLNNPPMGPAIIQALAAKNLMDVVFADLNLELQLALREHQLKYGILYEWCQNIRSNLTNDEETFLNNFVKPYFEDINKYDLLNISVFSIHSQNFTEWFLTKCKKEYQGKIIVGGAGIGMTSTGNVYGKELFDKKLVDYYIVGEGELAWEAIIRNNLPHPGVNGVPHENLINFDDVPLPNYSFFKLDEYFNSKSLGTTIGVEGSRGCVRNCTFCDIRSFWKKYKFKDGVKLAKELIELKSKYNVKHFFFNDSLINGSDKAFKDFILKLAEYNKLNKNNSIQWSAYYIVKQKIVYKEHDWINLRDSGAQSLFIGIESGSERVRDHMGKKFSDEDIEHTMNKLQRYGIRCTWLLIIGYPTETREDFEQTLDILKKYKAMGIDRTIDTVALGTTLSILDGSPLGGMKEVLNIQSAVGDHYGGVYWETEANDFKTRLAWRIEAEKLIRELGYNSWVGENDMVKWFEERLKDIEAGRVSDVDSPDHHG